MERLKYKIIPTTTVKIKISTNKQVITEQPKSTKFLEPNLPDLCSINHPDSLLLTSNHHLYIFHKKWVRIMNINDKRYRDPKLISEYLPFVKQISHIYQRPSEEVVIIDKNKYSYYFIGFPSFQIKHSGNVYEP